MATRRTRTLTPALTLVLLIAAPSLLGPAVGAGTEVVSITDAEATPIKAGRRAVFTWTTPFEGDSVVRYGRYPLALQPAAAMQSPASPMVETLEARLPTRAHVAVADGLAVGATYYYQVETTSPDGSRVARSALQSFRAGNAYTLEPSYGRYVANVMVRLDWDIRSGEEWERWRDTMQEFATRIRDATDGHVAIGRVILTDSFGASATGVSLCDAARCATAADVLYLTVLPHDSHTFAMGIDTHNPIQLGRNGQLLAAPWRDARHAGHVLAHEYLHYAAALDDQYGDGAALTGSVACVNEAYDVSIMHNSHVFTEIDSLSTPCEFHEERGYSNWDVMRGAAGSPRGKFYHIPKRAGAPDPGPSTPGEAYGVRVLDRGATA